MIYLVEKFILKNLCKILPYQHFNLFASSIFAGHTVCISRFFFLSFFNNFLNFFHRYMLPYIIFSVNKFWRSYSWENLIADVAAIAAIHVITVYLEETAAVL